MAKFKSYLYTLRNRRAPNRKATVTRKVQLIGEGRPVINVGVPLTSTVAGGFVLTAGASGSVIRGFIFDDLELGVFSSCTVGGPASDVVVEHNTFVNNSEGIVISDPGNTCGGGDGWTIQHNTFKDIRSDISNCGGGLGVFLFNVENTAVLYNRFTGTLFEPPCGSLFSTAAIFLSGCKNTHVIHNDIEMGDDGQLFKFDIALFGFQPGGGPNTNSVIANNDARGSDAPFFGLNYAVFDNFTSLMQCNFGTTFIGDFDNTEFFTEVNCRRRALPPNEALARPNAASIPAR